LIEDDIGDQLSGKVEQALDQRTHVVDHLNGVAVAARFHDGDVGGLLAVDAYDVVLQLAGVFGLADIPHGNPTRVDRLNGNIV
jgi:hypothetical protein